MDELSAEIPLREEDPTTGFESSISHASEGVRHLPQTDIESIRDVVRGYEASGGILKELIQNAEDAKALNMKLVFVPGHLNDPQSLLRLPGLLVINDGDFRPEHRDAIRQISLGTKGTEDRAIGRFGKGLKSVFRWCEAFFIIAHTGLRHGWKYQYVADLFNPWHGWRHQEWDQEAETYRGQLVRRVEGLLESDAGERWLSLWFPLRQQRPDGQDSEQEWIEDYFPGDDPEFVDKLRMELRTLAPSLVTLRNLERISLPGKNPGQSLALDFPNQSSRIPPPDDPAGINVVSGHFLVGESEGAQQVYRFCGLAGRLTDGAVAHLKQSQDWPKVVQNNVAGCRAKGEPHFGTLISSTPAKHGKTGSLDLRWSVFFPVGKQPPDLLPRRLSSIHQDITLILHGFFFLDSERLRIDGLDEQFKGGNSKSKSCVEWNRIIASQGTLAQLPEAFAHFAQLGDLNSEQCSELARTFTETWTWRTFRHEICQLYSWRPRWRSGVDKWELISVADNVFRIPTCKQPERLLEQIVTLGELSEEVVLVSTVDEQALSGLYKELPDCLPEVKVLQLFSSADLSSSDCRSTVEWINELLTQLHDHGSLTSEILKYAMDLPLLEAKSVRTDALIRLTGNQWLQSAENLTLFGEVGQTRYWARLLCGALPDWVSWAGSIPPRWFQHSVLASLNATTAAEIILGQSSFGDFPHRSQLVQALAQYTRFAKAVPSAMRLLMHGDSAHAQDETTILFVPSTQLGQRIWMRLIKQLLSRTGEAESWRLLDDQWSLILSQQIQTELNVYSVDATGAWAELVNCGSGLETLVFSVNEWTTEDVCTVFEGVFQVGGQSRLNETLAILRKLAIHTLHGRPKERVSISDAQGELSDQFILNTPGFEADLPNSLQPIWQSFLSEAHVVEDLPSGRLAATVQRNLFQKRESGGGEYFVQLEWNYVLRRCLDSTTPADRAPLIMEALGRRGDQSVRGLGSKFKQTKWIPLALSGSIAPDSVIHLDGLDDDLHLLLDPQKDGLAGINALQEPIRAHAGFGTLRNYLPRPDQALGMLGLWLDERADWYIGLTKPNTLTELEPILSQLREFDDVPAASLLLKCKAAHIRGYEEGIDALVAEHLVPAVLKRFGDSQIGIEKLESILRRLEGQQDHCAFNAYLAQSCIDGKLAGFLPRLRLVNQRGQWISATHLIWPSTNLDPAAQLCDEQTKILAPLRDAETRAAMEPSPSSGDQLQTIRGYQLSEVPDFDAEAKKLRNYLQPFRTGNLGENLPAALVAVLGANPGMLSLLDELLHAGIGMDRDNFLAWLLGDRADHLADLIRSGRFLIQIVRGESIATRTITGNEVNVEFTKEIKSLLVGNPDDLWFTHYYQSRMDTACHLLRLRWVQDPEQLEDAVAVFAATIQTIILKVYCNGVSDLCPANLREVLSGIADAGQTNLKRSRSYLLDIAEARLRELGVKDVPQLSTVLQNFADAQRARVDADILGANNPDRSKQRAAQAERLFALAKHGLAGLLEAEPENATQFRLVDAVRRKMNDYQYSLGSVTFELFQNADDAVAELEEMQDAEIPAARRFALRMDRQERVLEICHWGRPINHYEYPGFRDGTKRGYDQDLEKMLTLNFSDKGVGPNSRPGLVTGRFGLGFKSVFFLAQQPEVISGRLAFVIKGGFFPVPLAPAVAGELRASALAYGVSGLTPTAIRLKWADRVRESEVVEAIDEFVAIAPVLPVFSRRIRTLTVLQDDRNTTWSAAETKLTGSGRLSYVRVGNKRFFCFRCQLSTDDRPATVMFYHDGSGIASMPVGWTGLWITTPTAERSDLKFALNAPFKPDAGRLRLAVSNSENLSIAEEIATVWADALVELFDYTISEWEKFSEVLELHEEASFESWWTKLWRETSRSSPVTEWKTIQNGGQALSWIAWGQSVGAMRKLVQNRAAIPTELPNKYSTLANQQAMRFSISGMLADINNGCFAQIAEWPSTQSAFPPGSTVHSTVAAYLRSADFPVEFEDVTLERVVDTAAGPEHEADHLVADHIGNIFVQCKSLFEMDSPYAVEIQRLLAWMKHLKLLAKDGRYHPLDELVSSRALPRVVEGDEALRSAFAPDSALLSPGYSDAALRFFVKARGQLAAGAPILADWARLARDEKLHAVFKYLVVGELGQQMADQLRRDWLDMQRESVVWRSLSRDDQNEIERKFLKGYQWQIPPVLNPESSEPDSIGPVMNAETAFILVSDWWRREQRERISEYENKTYPAGFPGSLPWPGDDDWESAVQPNARARWLLLFIHAALVPLGFNMIGRDRRFSQFLISRGWLDVLARAPQDPEVLIAALDQYLGAYIQNTEYHFQMRQLVAFYAVASNLESLLLSLRESERCDGFGNLRLAFSPRANPALTGTGIDVPPLTGMLGIGACQLLRELYRVGRLSTPSGYQFAFTPVRKVRRLCFQLFGISEGPSSIESSQSIHNALSELGATVGRDASFDRCFDLPLQMLAQDRNLRGSVLKVDFEVSVDEDADAAPQVDEII